jgi:hypothetical protein
MTRLVRLLATILLLSVALPLALAAPPTALESFVRRQTARIAWSAEMGRIRSGDSLAIITAMLVDESGPPVRQMRGVRISVSKPGVAADLYVEEEQLPSAVMLLRTVSEATAQSRRSSCTSPVPAWLDAFQ